MIAHSKAVPLFLVAFLVGAMARSFFTIPDLVLILTLGFGFGVLLILYYFVHQKIGLPASRSILLILTITVFVLGALRFSFAENSIVSDELHKHYGEAASLTGVVVKVYQKPNSARIVLRTTRGKLLVITQVYPKYRYGDVLEMAGALSEPELYGAFDMKTYLAKDGIYTQAVFPGIKKIGFAPSSKIFSFLFWTKERFQNSIAMTFPEPHASLITGMLLGDEGVLPNDLRSAFNTTGTSHILVLSGYNITLVGALLMGICGALFSQRISLIVSVGGIILFTLMTGAEAPAVRAAIMAFVALLAFRTGRRNAPMRALLLAAFLMALINPFILRFDRGFQLSFLATFGLIVASPLFLRAFHYVPEAFALRQSAASTLAAQMFVLPLIVSWGNDISLVAPIANLIIVSLVPLVMFWGFIAGIVGLFLENLAIAFGSVAYIAVSLQIFLVFWFSNFPILQSILF